MGMFARLSMVMMVTMVLMAVLVVGAKGNPVEPGYWDQWRYLLQQRRAQETPQKVTGPPVSRLWAAHQRQQKLEEEQEMEEERQEALQGMLEGINMEEMVVALGTDVLSTIIKPHITAPSGQGPACLTRTYPVTLPELMPPMSGEIVYTVCGAGDAASLHLRYQELGDTTPSLDLTTAADATTATAFPLCPNLPTTTTPSEAVTTTADATTTTTTPTETTTTATEPEANTAPA